MASSACYLCRMNNVTDQEHATVTPRPTLDQHEVSMSDPTVVELHEDAVGEPPPSPPWNSNNLTSSQQLCNFLSNELKEQNKSFEERIGCMEEKLLQRLESLRVEVKASRENNGRVSDASEAAENSYSDNGVGFGKTMSDSALQKTVRISTTNDDADDSRRDSIVAAKRMSNFNKKKSVSIKDEISPIRKSASYKERSSNRSDASDESGVWDSHRASGKRSVVETRNSITAFQALDVWNSEHFRTTVRCPSGTLNRSETQNRLMINAGFVGQASRAGFDSDSGSLEEDLDEGGQVLTNRLSRFMMHPSCTKRLVWDVHGMVLIAYDVITIPLYNAFEFGPSDFVLALFWITFGFWNCDMLFTFFTGFYNQDQLEMRPAHIAWHYMKTWLPLDIIVVGADWMVIILGGDSSGGARLARASKAVRAIRILRSLRLLRLVKVRKIVQDIQDHINSEFVHIMLNILKLILLIVFICHCTACAWYVVGTETPDGVVGWVEAQNFDDEPIEYRYMSSLHWSLAQFTPANNELRAHNTWERFFATIVLLGGLIVFSSFVSSITTAMTKLRHLSSNTDTQLSVLRRYLRQRQVSPQLSVRIQKYCEFVVTTRHQQIQQNDVQALQVLSLPLQKLLARETYAPVLLGHPFFNYYARQNQNAFQELCHSAVSYIYLSSGDCVFSVGETAKLMYLVTKGKLKYLRPIQTDPSSSQRSAGIAQPSEMSTKVGTGSISTANNGGPSGSTGAIAEEIVRAGQWLCEVSLWVNWSHVGTLHASTFAEILCVSTEKFAAITKTHQTCHYMCSRYATQYVETLNTMGFTEVNDVCMGPEQVDTVLAGAFPEEFGFEAERERVGRKTMLNIFDSITSSTTPGESQMAGAGRKSIASQGRSSKRSTGRRAST